MNKSVQQAKQAAPILSVIEWSAVIKHKKHTKRSFNARAKEQL